MLGWARLFILPLAAACLFAVVAIGVRISLEVISLRSSPANNAQWSVSQLEADYLRLSSAAVEATRGGDLDPFRLRYDLFYSRVADIENGQIFEELRANPQAGAALDRLLVFVKENVRAIDGSDPDLADSLARLRTGIAALEPSVRSILQESALEFAAEVDARASLFESLLLAAALTAGALVTLLALSVAVLVRQQGRLRRQTMAALRARERFASMVNASLDAVVVVNAKGVILEFSETAEAVFGLSREAAIGRQMGTSMIPKRHRNAYFRGLKRYAETGENTMAGRIELTALRADGAEFPAELSICAATDTNGPIFISYVRDISDRRAARRALTEARDRALSADRAKSDFIAVMSHEMRTPLSGVLGVLDLLKATDLTPRQSDLVKVATSSGEILLHHINDVLDLARIESGKLEPQLQAMDLGAVVCQVVELSSAAASARGNLLEAAPDQPSRILMGDPHLIRQMLLNLVGNAAKFTRNGKIVVAVRILSEDDAGAKVELSVTDTGIGVDRADQERIFEDFVMVDAAYQREGSGSGLGLAICRRVATALGGRIGVESEPGQGSRFWIRLWLARAPEGEAAVLRRREAAAELSRPLRILLVDDNGTNRQVAREMLEAGGHEVVEARDGREGVSLALAQRFDVILMDVSMPGIDGIEATRRIRSGDGASSAAPIVALTAHALPDDVRQFRSAGMQDCIVKPIRRRALVEALARISFAEGYDDAPSPPAGLIDGEVFGELAAALPEHLLADTLRKVVAEIRQALPVIASAAALRDLDALAFASHRLAGSAGIVGAASLHGQLASIETGCKTGDADAATAAASRLAGTAEATCAKLEELAITSSHAAE